LHDYERDFMITKYDISLCCQIFFGNGRLEIRDQIPEYQSIMHILTNNEGVILCPDCLVNRLTNRGKGQI